MSTWDQIQQAIGEARGEPFVADGRSSQGGGCINQAFSITGDDGSSYFVKLNQAGRLSMFEAEAQGLQAMHATRTVRVPEPLVTGAGQEHSFIVMEKLSLGGSGGGAAEKLGTQLAAMHRHGEPRFGFHCDNTIGSTHQPNDWASDWVDFWRDQRLGYQLDLAGRNGCGRGLLHQGERLLASFPTLFESYSPAVSLIHGDLWAGNWSTGGDGEPVIFDPATYYGDREAELAMTELFGGFGTGFYAAYNEAWPLDPGYEQRKTLYKLYHVLNHFNLFGGGYASQAESMMDRLLSELSG
ncbi:MAG: fructosamine kinase family protein [Gammaproteobacteria bacterium]